MTYLFTGMIIGGIIGILLGCFSVYARCERYEINRLRREIKEVRADVSKKS